MPFAWRDFAPEQAGDGQKMIQPSPSPPRDDDVVGPSPARSAQGDPRVRVILVHGVFPDSIRGQESQERSVAEAVEVADDKVGDYPGRFRGIQAGVGGYHEIGAGSEAEEEGRRRAFPPRKKQGFHPSQSRPK